jgi:hypothetical protein
MTLGNMRGERRPFVVRVVLALPSPAVQNADCWPDDVPVPTFGPRMACTRCGIVGADARPNWNEQPPQETLTGVQWRR